MKKKAAPKAAIKKKAAPKPTPAVKKKGTGKPAPKLHYGGNRTDLDTSHKVIRDSGQGVVNITRKSMMYLLHLDDGKIIECRSLVNIPSYRFEVSGVAYDDLRTIHRKRELDKVLHDELQATK